MSIISFIVPILVSAALTALMVPLIIRFSWRKKLFDVRNERTVHSGVVPRLGGSAFILPVMVAVALEAAGLSSCGESPACGFAARCGWTEYSALIGAALIIYLGGLWDDIKRINYKIKFLCQLVSALLIVFVGGFWINNFYGLFGVWALPPVVGKVFTVLLIMYIINAFNLIDGIDGLAASIGIIAAGVTGVLLTMSGECIMAVMAFALAASLVVFFCYNVFGSTKRHTKIFMGDGGSQTMGLIIAFLVVYLSMKRDGRCVPMLPCEAGLEALRSPVVSFCLIIIPCFDAVRVMFGRIMRDENPFLPDQTHIHHKFLRLGYSATQTLIAIVALDVVFIAVNIALAVADLGVTDGWMINVILVLDLAIWIGLHWWLNRRLKIKELREAPSQPPPKGEEISHAAGRN